MAPYGLQGKNYNNRGSKKYEGAKRQSGPVFNVYTHRVGTTKMLTSI